MTRINSLEIEQFIKEYQKTEKEAEILCYMSRAKELHQEAVKKLEILKNKAKVLKEQMICSNDEESANIMLCIENIIHALCNELNMWIALKDDDPDTGWDYLIDAQDAVGDALLAHNISIDLKLDEYSIKLHLLEKILFPPQTFMSPCQVITGTKCSICGKNYDECDHITGKAYMGKLCREIVTGIKEVRSIDYVDEPADKCARALEFTKDGKTRNIMTWRIIKEDKNVENTDSKMTFKFVALRSKSIEDSK